MIIVRLNVDHVASQSFLDTASRKRSRAELTPHARGPAALSIHHQQQQQRQQHQQQQQQQHRCWWWWWWW
uniref:Uncharacterized protein n=1 Tax=Vespula pensylvanica TaxID=30213 RepID=A0A834NAM6_VESPE|nr:hypothetical protein H0235_015311 [Vespula pensylvanica]